MTYDRTHIDRLEQRIASLREAHGLGQAPEAEETGGEARPLTREDLGRMTAGEIRAARIDGRLDHLLRGTTN